jgi:hypothetical protein
MDIAAESKAALALEALDARLERSHSKVGSWKDLSLLKVKSIGNVRMLRHIRWRFKGCANTTL